MPGFLSELERQSYPDQSTNALADDFARQSAANPRAFDKGLLNRILGEETASPAREQRTFSGDFEVDPINSPPYRYSPPRPASVANLMSRVIDKINTADAAGPATANNMVAAPGPAAGPPVGQPPSPQEQIAMLLKIIQQTPQAPDPQRAATVPFQMPGASRDQAQAAVGGGGLPYWMPSVQAAPFSLTGVPSPQMRPPLSPYGNQLFGGNQFGGNQFGGNQFGGNRFGGNRFGGNQFGASARPPQAVPIPQFARGGFLRMMRGGYPADLMMGLPQRHNFGQGDYVQPDGRGDGRSDHVEARLSPGEFVIDAETTSMLGNGDNEAGARRLEEMRRRVRRHKGSALAKGKFSPDARSPEAYLNDSPRKRP